MKLAFAKSGITLTPELIGTAVGALATPAAGALLMRGERDAAYALKLLALAALGGAGGAGLGHLGRKYGPRAAKAVRNLAGGRGAVAVPAVAAPTVAVSDVAEPAAEALAELVAESAGMPPGLLPFLAGSAVTGGLGAAAVVGPRAYRWAKPKVKAVGKTIGRGADAARKELAMQLAIARASFQVRAQQVIDAVLDYLSHKIGAGGIHYEYEWPSGYRRFGK